MKTQITSTTLGSTLWEWAKKKSRGISIFFSLATLSLVYSCSYFTVRNVPFDTENVSGKIQEFNTTEKYVVLHSGDFPWHLKDVVINEDEQVISGVVEPLNEEHIYRKAREDKRVHGYQPKKTKPFNEIHFYLKSDKSFANNSSIEIPLTEIERISVNDKNTGKAVANVILTGIGVLVVALLLYAALKSSCPFVYIKNGEEYDFVGELYPGIITANMQQDDYLQLPNMMAQDGQYVLKVANQLKEIQYTDQLQLIVANHSKNMEVLMDIYGNVQTFTTVEPPKQVILDDGSTNRAPALQKDGVNYTFNTEITSPDATRSVLFEFDRPENIENAKLYLSVKNSAWLDYIFGKFNEQFGSYYNTHQHERQKMKGHRIRKWVDKQNIPLSIYLKKGENWELVENINTVGPLANRNIAVPLEAADLESDKLQIKLETGFMFWEVDFVGINYSPNETIDLHYVSPEKATDHYGTDVTALLRDADQTYLKQPNIGDEVVVSFPSITQEEDSKQTIFLKNRGYYNYIRDYQGEPDFVRLQKFREESAFTRFSEDYYFGFVDYYDSKTIQ